MKSFLFAVSIFLFFSSFSWSKTRLGNYYVGFGVGRLDHPSQRVDVNGTRQFKEMDGVTFDVDLNLPLSYAFDFNLNFARSDFSDDNFSMHHNQLDGVDLVFLLAGLGGGTGGGVSPVVARLARDHGACLLYTSDAADE